MYFERARRQIEARSFPDPGDIHPCAPDEVAALERKLGAPLPEALREFLLWCGRGLGDIWSGNRCLEYEELIEGSDLDAARAVLLREGHDTSLLNDPVLVFQFDECGQFSFVRLDEGDDPPVYGHDEGEPIRRYCDHFGDYVDLIVDQEFGTEEGYQEVEGGGMLSSSTPAELPSIVPPDLQPDGSWVEESYGFLPPSVQSRLGELRASFQPSGANVFAGLVFGVGFIAAGLGLIGLGIRELALEHFQLPVFTNRGMSWVMVAVIGAAGAGMAAGGVAMIRHLLRLSGSRLFVGESGLCRTRDGRHEVLLWTDIGQIDEVVLRDRAPVNTPVTWFIPFGKSRRLVLHARDGRELSFDPNNVRSFARFEALLRRAASLHRLPWSVVEPPR